MSTKFLVITNRAESVWLETLKRAAASLGVLDLAAPEAAELQLPLRRDDMIILDSAAVKNPAGLVERLRFHHPEVPILVATLSRSWQRTRGILQAGATDCVLKSMTADEWTELIEKTLGRTRPVEEVRPALRPTILLADNDPDFLATRREILERAGYAVITAHNPEEARHKLSLGSVDLAVLDIRLEDDDDERDVSGLLLAKRMAPTVPKIILTNFPTFDYVREALRPQLDVLPVAVDFLMKAEGVATLLATVKDLLETAALQKSTGQPQSRVFIAHGHDSTARETVSGFLRDLGIKPIILFEEADRGETIIEKLERCCQEADFAIILFTADDVGYPREDPTGLKPRARQNVIFELGYMAARLGRRRVRVLYEHGVEIPTNFLGVLYIEMDRAEKWKAYLGRELKDAGIRIKGRARTW